MTKNSKKPAKKKVAQAKKTAAVEVPAQPEAPRRIKAPTYQSFKLQKRIKGDPLPGAFRLFGRAIKVLAKNWKLFLGIVAVYGLLNMLLVQSFNAAGNLSESKAALDELFTGGVGQLANGISLFVYLLSLSGNTVSPTAGAYQLMLSITVSLALIWALRQVYAEKTVRIRDGFYNGMAPLVQFILLLLVVGIQLIPLAIGIFLFSTATGSGIVVGGFELLLWSIVLFVLVLISLYMVCSSIFALYIVTLPGMTPMQALRSARQLVRYRRWAIMRKIILLPVILILLSALIMIPLILFATPIAVWAFFAVTMLLLPITHSYMYSLYRAMM